MLRVSAISLDFCSNFETGNSTLVIAEVDSILLRKYCP